MGDDWDRGGRRNERYDEDSRDAWRDRLRLFEDVMKDVDLMRANLSSNAPSDAMQAADRIRRALGGFLDV